MSISVCRHMDSITQWQGKTDPGAWVEASPCLYLEGTRGTTTQSSLARITHWPGFPSGKEPICQDWRHKRCEFNPWVGKIPWRRAQQPTAVYLPGESHGQSSLGQSSVWGCTQLDITSSLAHTFTGPAEGQGGRAEQCPRNDSRPCYLWPISHKRCLPSGPYMIQGLRLVSGGGMLWLAFPPRASPFLPRRDQTASLALPTRDAHLVRVISYTSPWEFLLRGSCGQSREQRKAGAGGQLVQFFVSCTQ